VEIESIESGSLLAVLRRASHHDLYEIVESINRAFDSLIKWDDRYKANREDLTKAPNFIADHLCRAGGHAVRNWFRGGGPDYPEVVQDVCAAVSVRLPEVKDRMVVDMEVALLKVLLAKATKNLSAEQQADLLAQMASAAGRPVLLDDVLNGGKALALFAPMILSFVAQQTVVKGLAAVAEFAVARLAASIAGPIGIVVGTLWFASDLAGPSLRGTIPAVAQVAILRQRLVWQGA
jgi:uncharacterized protein YaaW (UPF0174 family)